MPSPSQRERAIAQLRAAGLLRASELRNAGITPSTLARLERDGAVMRVGRGVYQLSDSQLDSQHSLALASKLVPGGVICLSSALAFYGLTDQIPAKVWMAIDPKAWRPRIDYPPMRFVRFASQRLSTDVEQHTIDSVAVPLFGVARTIADLFRYRETIGLPVALEGLREALSQKKATPAELARKAIDAGVWKIMEPYLSALSSHH